MFFRASVMSLAAAAILTSVSLAQDQPPVCNNNGPYQFEVNATPGTHSTDVKLSSAGSFDPDGDPLSFFWFEECALAFFVDPTSPDATLTFDMTDLCTQTCVVALRVTANGVTVHCNTTVTVTDTLAPTITCPPDASMTWTFQAWSQGPDPAQTGYATATDNSGDIPNVTYSDQTFSDPVGSGLENHVIRTWVASDNCGNSASCQQIIYLLSPNALAGPNLDLQLGSCPNVIDRTAPGTTTLTVLTNAKVNASNIDWSTLRLQRITDTTKQTSLGSGVFTKGDFGRVTATFPGGCNSSKRDGKADLQISISTAALIPALGLDTEQAGTNVELWLTGQFTSGKYFALRDFAIVQ